MTNAGLPAVERHYEYIISYVNDLMVDSRWLYQLMQAISQTYQLKKENKTVLSYGPPDVYLGYQILKHQDPENESKSFCYSMSNNDYVNNIIANVQNIIMDHRREFNYKQIFSFVTGYRHELDASPKLDQYFPELIGILN